VAKHLQELAWIQMTKRDLLRAAYRVFPREIPLIDYINPNVAFQAKFVDRLDEMKVFDERNESKLAIIDYLQNVHIRD
jgi:hypothetical protein